MGFIQSTNGTPRRRIVRPLRAALGDAWTDYTSSGRGPAGGRVTSPNGDVVVFDSNGTPDYTISAPQSDATVDKDPNSPFFGWTNLQKAAFAAAQGVTGLVTDAVRAAGVIQSGQMVESYDPAAVAASDANLRELAQHDAVVSSALHDLETGTGNTNNGAYTGAQHTAIDAGNAATIRGNMQTLLNNWLSFREVLDADQGYVGARPPRFPPASYTGTLDAANAAALQSLFDALPPDGPRGTPTYSTDPGPIVNGGGGGGGGGTGGGGGGGSGPGSGTGTGGTNGTNGGTSSSSSSSSKWLWLLAGVGAIAYAARSRS